MLVGWGAYLGPPWVIEGAQQLWHYLTAVIGLPTKLKIVIGFYQIAKNYYWPGVGEPSSAEECAINKEAYDALAPDLQQAVAYACQSLYDQVLTEYNTNHAKALPKLVEEQGVTLHKVPEEILVAHGNAAGEVIAELRADGDELVKRIVESFLAYRNSLVDYMQYADGGVMSARLLDYGYGE